MESLFETGKHLVYIELDEYKHPIVLSAYGSDVI